MTVCFSVCQNENHKKKKSGNFIGWKAESLLKKTEQVGAPLAERVLYECFSFNARLVVTAPSIHHPFTVMLIPPPALSKHWLLSSTEVSEVREAMLSGRTELRIKGFSSVHLQIGICWTRLEILNSQWGHWTGTRGSLILFLIFFYLLCSAY